MLRYIFIFPYMIFIMQIHVDHQPCKLKQSQCFIEITHRNNCNNFQTIAELCARLNFVTFFLILWGYVIWNSKTISILLRYRWIDIVVCLLSKQYKFLKKGHFNSFEVYQAQLYKWLSWNFLYISKFWELLQNLSVSTTCTTGVTNDALASTPEKAY